MELTFCGEHPIGKIKELLNSKLLQWYFSEYGSWMGERGPYNVQVRAPLTVRAFSAVNRRKPDCPGQIGLNWP